MSEFFVRVYLWAVALSGLAPIAIVWLVTPAGDNIQRIAMTALLLGASAFLARLAFCDFAGAPRTIFHHPV